MMLINRCNFKHCIAVYCQWTSYWVGHGSICTASPPQLSLLTTLCMSIQSSVIIIHGVNDIPNNVFVNGRKDSVNLTQFSFVVRELNPKCFVARLAIRFAKLQLWLRERHAHSVCIVSAPHFVLHRQ